MVNARIRRRWRRVREGRKSQTQQSRSGPMTIRSMLFASALLASSASAAPMYGAQDLLPNAPSVAWAAKESMVRITLMHSAELEALRKDGLALQASDGGTLSPAHRAQ